ncbi:MFS transporter [Bacilliculturomica massiliensis]|uniref:MFS transporter n=1 Tax=Bacilliculturomica massiliensis TaxID=1917867 RepID=UPI0010324ECD|nr:MFS transporter [Bacilliculturomica massiliensis]
MRRNGWLIWSVLVFAYAINFFHSLSMGVVKEDLMEEFQMSETSFISIGNMYANLYLIMQIPAGLLADWLGPRKTASAGMFLATVGVILFGAAPSAGLLYVGRSLVGLGTSVLFVCILKIQASWFPEPMFGTLTGWTCFIGTMGGAFAQTPLAVLTAAVGWRMAFLGVGVMSLAVTASIVLIVRDVPGDALQDALQLEDGRPVQKGLAAGAADLRTAERGAEASGSGTESLSARLRGAAGVLKNPRTWPIFFTYASFYGSFVVLMGYYGTSFITEVYGMSTVTASLFTTAGVVGSAVGAAVIGSLSDRMRSRKKPAVWAGAGYLACWAVLTALAGKIPGAALGPLFFITGFLSYAYVVSWPAAREVNDPKVMGVAASVTNMGGFMGSIFIPICAGRVFTSGGGVSSNTYGSMFLLVTAFVAAGLFSALLMKETGCRNCWMESGDDSGKVLRERELSDPSALR